MQRVHAGRRAADGGWVLSLHDFCRKQGRLPIGPEIPRLKASARGFDDAYRDAYLIKGLLGVSVLALGRQMLARREALGRLARGEVRP